MNNKNNYSNSIKTLAFLLALCAASLVQGRIAGHRRYRHLDNNNNNNNKHHVSVSVSLNEDNNNNSSNNKTLQPPTTGKNGGRRRRPVLVVTEANAVDTPTTATATVHKPDLDAEWGDLFGRSLQENEQELSLSMSMDMSMDMSMSMPDIVVQEDHVDQDTKEEEGPEPPLPDEPPVLLDSIPGTLLAASASTADEEYSFEILLQALQATNLWEALTEEGPFTLLAPTDEAFAALPQDLLVCLVAEPDNAYFASILLYHLMSGGKEWFSKDFMKEKNEDGDLITVLETQNTGMLTFSVLEQEDYYDSINSTTAVVTINNSSARIVQADLMATNGVIHVVDQVLLPPALNLTAFVTRCKMQQAEEDLMDWLHNSSDTFHNDTILVWDEEVNTTDPFWEGDEEHLDLALDLAETLEVSNLTLFATALEAVNGTDTFSFSSGLPLTIFVPQDEAFGFVSSFLLDCLLRPENGAYLQAILDYHIIPGEALMAGDFVNASEWTTLGGETLVVTNMDEAGVQINEAMVVHADIGVSNGIVVHIIDTVLVPPNLYLEAVAPAILENCPDLDSFSI